MVCLTRPVQSDSGQFVLGFYVEHTRALDRQRERLRRERAERSAQRRRERRGSLRHVLDLMELPPAYMTAQELADCDAYIARAMGQIRDGWTQEQEAMARGVDLRKCAKIFVSDGRIFQDDYSIGSVSVSELWWEGDGDE